MICPKCGSEDTRIELVNNVSLKKKKNWIYWLCGLWILYLLLWIGFFLFRLIIKILKKPSYKVKNKAEKYLICNHCGYSEKIK